MEDANYFLKQADRCFELRRLAGANSELAAALNSMAEEFMAKAVELDTQRDREMTALRRKRVSPVDDGNQGN